MNQRDLVGTVVVVCASYEAALEEAVLLSWASDSRVVVAQDRSTGEWFYVKSGFAPQENSWTSGALVSPAVGGGKPVVLAAVR